MIKIKLVNAVITKSRGFFSSYESYCLLAVGNEVHRSSVKESSGNNLVWNEYFRFSDQSSILNVSLMTKSTFKDDCMGKGVIDISRMKSSEAENQVLIEMYQEAESIGRVQLIVSGLEQLKTSQYSQTTNEVFNAFFDYLSGRQGEFAAKNQKQKPLKTETNEKRMKRVDSKTLEPAQQSQHAFDQRGNQNNGWESLNPLNNSGNSNDYFSEPNIPQREHEGSSNNVNPFNILNQNAFQGSQPQNMPGWGGSQNHYPNNWNNGPPNEYPRPNIWSSGPTNQYPKPNVWSSGPTHQNQNTGGWGSPNSCPPTNQFGGNPYWR